MKLFVTTVSLCNVVTHVMRALKNQLEDLYRFKNYFPSSQKVYAELGSVSRVRYVLDKAISKMEGINL